MYIKSNSKLLRLKEVERQDKVLYDRVEHAKSKIDAKWTIRPRSSSSGNRNPSRPWRKVFWESEVNRGNAALLERLQKIHNRKNPGN